MADALPKALTGARQSTISVATCAGERMNCLEGLVIMRKHTPIPIGIDRMDAALDEALEESFPASDPIAISCTSAVARVFDKPIAPPWKRTRRGSFLAFRTKTTLP
jgi:hypothetical protein